MSLKRVWIPSPNYSSRGGSGVRLVIIHTAEGATTAESLGNFFASASAGVSSHVGIDDTPGRVCEYVKRPDKAWTAGDANPHSVNAELCGFAAWSPQEWERHASMLDVTAQWIAEECAYWGIPVRKLASGPALSGQAGVCGHVDVSGPGGHWDPGNATFPWSRVIEAAQTGQPVYGEPAPPPPPPVQIPTAILGGLGTVPDYIIHDTGSDDYFAAYASGLIRFVTKAERDQLAGTPQVNAKFSDENLNRYRDYDRALRGLVEKRG